MRRLSNIVTLFCVLTVISIECGPNLVSNVETNLISNDSGTQFYTEDDGTGAYSDEDTQTSNRRTRSLGDEPIYPKVEKFSIKR